MTQKPLTALLLATAFALPLGPVLAEVNPPAGMAPNAANVVLPDARNNLGLPANWVQQYHQNGGGSASGHVLGWGDQNYDILADHIGAQSQDASIINSATLGGSNTVGDQIGWQIGAAHSYITVATGDTSAIILNKLASALQGGALTATIAGGASGGYTNNDVVSLAGVSASCVSAPSFKLTVAAGSVTAAVIAPSAGGSALMGGYCTATPAGPFAVTGGSGTGLTLNAVFADPAIAVALLAIHDGNGIGYAATANIQVSAINFDFPWNGTLLTCASGGTGSGCPGAPTETITVASGGLDNGPFGYMARWVPNRTPQVNDAIGWWRVDGASSGTSGLDTQYAGIKVRVGTVSSSAPEGIPSLEGATGGNKGSLPLLSCLGSKGCWVEDGAASNPNQALGTARGGFAAATLRVGPGSLVGTSTVRSPAATDNEMFLDSATPGQSVYQQYASAGSVKWQVIKKPDDTFAIYRNGSSGYALLASASAVVLGENSNITLTNAGGTQIGAPTGGDKGAGTLNLQSTPYVQGTQMATTNLSDVVAPATWTAADASGFVTLTNNGSHYTKIGKSCTVQLDVT